MIVADLCELNWMLLSYDDFATFLDLRVSGEQSPSIFVARKRVASKLLWRFHANLLRHKVFCLSAPYVLYVPDGMPASSFFLSFERNTKSI